MDSRRSSSSGTGAAVDDPPVEAETCPRCGEALALLPPVEPAALSGTAVRRCARCGTRSTEEPDRRLVFSCEACGVPFTTESPLPHDERLCAPCRDGETPRPPPDARAVIATEAEVRTALARRWRFVTSASIAPYLERVTRQVAQRVEGAPDGARAVLLEDAALRTLALPSGTILVSTGLLQFLEDEAELVFVLAHELAHTACGDAAARLVRLGFEAVARGREAPAAEAWTQAAEDLARLGYGRKRERDADQRAIETVLALDYDPESACRYLRRLHAAIEKGDPAVAEMTVAHPPPLDRLRRLERSLWGRMHEGKILRVNREVFRRAASPASLTTSLLATGLPALPTTAPQAVEEVMTSGTRDASSHRILWGVVALGALIVAAATALVLLSQ